MLFLSCVAWAMGSGCTFVDGSITYAELQDQAQARERVVALGRALGAERFERFTLLAATIQDERASRWAWLGGGRPCGGDAYRAEVDLRELSVRVRCGPENILGIKGGLAYRLVDRRRVYAPDRALERDLTEIKSAMELPMRVAQLARSGGGVFTTLPAASREGRSYLRIRALGSDVARCSEVVLWLREADGGLEWAECPGAPRGWRGPSGHVYHFFDYQEVDGTRLPVRIAIGRDVGDERMSWTLTLRSPELQ